MKETTNRPDHRTVMLTIVLGLCSWTLTEVVAQGKSLSVVSEKVIALERVVFKK